MTSPFLTAPVAYSGLALPRDRRYNPTSRRFWLGKPGRMVQIPSPSIGYAAKPGQGESVTTNGAGGSSVRRRGAVKWRWDFTYSKLIGADLELILGFYMRTVVGNGPWCFVPPEFTNLLTLAQSLTGNLNGVVEGWTADAGTLAYDSTVTPAVLPAGVLRWTSPGASGNLARIGHATTLGVDLANAVPYIPAEPFTASVWAAKASGTLSARMRLLGIAADGVSVTGTVTGPTVSLAAAPSRLTATVSPGGLSGAAYLAPAVENLTASGPNMLLSAAQLRLGSTPADWGAGRGVPRVIWADAPEQTIDSLYGSNPTMTLAQA